MDWQQIRDAAVAMIATWKPEEYAEQRRGVLGGLSTTEEVVEELAAHCACETRDAREALVLAIYHREALADLEADLEADE